MQPHLDPVKHLDEKFFGKTGVTIEKQGFIRFLLTAKPF
jgi:hypothetical protein